MLSRSVLVCEPYQNMEGEKRRIRSQIWERQIEYKALGGQHISEAVHFESQIPENLLRYNMQHCLLTSAIDQAGHSSCQAATRAHIDLLFWKVHANMPVSCHIPNPETVI